jgi:membrane protein
MRKLLERRPVRLLVGAGRGFVEDNCGEMAAALAYFTLLSAFPLLLLLVSQLPRLLALFGVNYYDIPLLLLDLIGNYIAPEVADWLSKGLLELDANRDTVGLIGLLTLLWSASGGFAQLDAAFNRIWRIYDESDRRTGIIAALTGAVRGRLVPFLLMLLVGLLLLLNSVLTAGLAVLQRFFPQTPYSGLLGSAFGLVLPVAVSTLALGLLYRYIPYTRVLWHDVWLGAFVAAVANELAKNLMTGFIASGTGGFYQSIAGPLALMIWVFFTSQIVFFGCELTRHYALIYGSRSTPAGAAQGAIADKQARVQTHGRQSA